MATEYVTVTRRVESEGKIIVETASAPLADDLSLDDYTESLRRQMLADALFHALPSVASTRVVIFGRPTGSN